jgi:hypothetical protein
MRIWPWSTISRLKRELDEEKDRSQMFEDELYKADPTWWAKKVIALHTSCPRNNCVITGIDVPE